MNLVRAAMNIISASFFANTCICNSSFSKDSQIYSPLLSYVDKKFQYTPRYFLDLTAFDSSKQFELHAYADIRNNGERTIFIKRAELISDKIFFLIVLISYFNL